MQQDVGPVVGKPWYSRLQLDSARGTAQPRFSIRLARFPMTSSMTGTAHAKWHSSRSETKHFEAARRRFGSLVVGTVTLLLAGCAQYQIGHQSLYRPDIQSVYVPIFESDSFRDGLGERLTEAVKKKIHSQTPYRLAAMGEADSVLTGRIIEERKRGIVENANDEPRNIEVGMVVQASWQDMQGNSLSQFSSFVPGPTFVNIAQTSDFVPEGGQSIATAQQTVIDRLSDQIVAQMEIPW